MIGAGKQENKVFGEEEVGTFILLKIYRVFWEDWAYEEKSGENFRILREYQ